MALYNSAAGYGSLTKAFHWFTVGAFAFQYAAAAVMTRMKPGAQVMGAGQDDYYNWHKSIGLIALAIALIRLWARKQGQLPDWAPTLTPVEQRFIHRAEQVLYAAMFVMPVSGLFYVMAGGYGVMLFGVVELPNPLPHLPALATACRLAHVAMGWLLLLTVLAHVGLVLRHQLVLKDGLLRRMLPARR
jgi:cytochrome b561